MDRWAVLIERVDEVFPLLCPSRASILFGPQRIGFERLLQLGNEITARL